MSRLLIEERPPMLRSFSHEALERASIESRAREGLSGRDGVPNLVPLLITRLQGGEHRAIHLVDAQRDSIGAHRRSTLLIRRCNIFVDMQQ